MNVSFHSLAVDKVKLDPGLARRLPPELAFRYHALPIAEAHQFTTVAMAEPENVLAREAIATALGTETHVVRGDQETIDSLLIQVWPDVTSKASRFLVSVQSEAHAEAVSDYARQVGDLLGAELDNRTATPGDADELDALVAEADGDYELLILHEPEPSLSDRLFSAGTGRQAVEQVETSVLLVRQPRWPLLNLLLVVRGEEADQPAVDWMIRLARASGAAVTVLVVVPSAPAMYNLESRAQVGLDILLLADSPPGRQLRHILQQMAHWDIKGRLQLRLAPPDQQIRQEVDEEAPDLIIIAAEHRSRLWRWWLGELVGPLLRWADRPVLIAR